ncbi:MAG: hypothetical protein IH830_11015 [Planctomycetes bacterium]|nr:hypothetical protein [Planctomycetota bacterium]
MNASRILALAGPGREEGWQSNLRWFRLFILMHMAGRSFLMIPTGPTADLGVQWLRSVIVVTALLGCIPRFSLWATRAAVLLLVGEIAITIPFTANHVFLEFLCLGFLSLLDERDEGEAELLMQALRWFVGVFFFYTGLQKLLYGYYFDGQLLAYLAGTEDRFAAFFRFIIPAEELQRLQSYNEALVRPGAYSTKLGAGPYRVDSLLFVVMSNGVYLFEMLAGMLLLVPRTRVLAAIASIGFVIMIELGARELTFGALMVNLLLLFLPGRWIKRLFPAFLLFYLYLAAHKLGWVSMFDYAPA